MSVHPLVQGTGPTVKRHRSVGHADVLDAWLGTMSQSTDRPPPRAEGPAVDWNAPLCPAELTYDTAEQPLPTGVRVITEGNRRLMFEAQAYEVMLRVAADRQSRQYDVAGQVLYEGLPLPGATVRLDRSDPTTTISTDQTGRFRLPPLVDGPFGLQIAVGGAVLAVPPIAL